MPPWHFLIFVEEGNYKLNSRARTQHFWKWEKRQKHVVSRHFLFAQNLPKWVGKVFFRNLIRHLEKSTLIEALPWKHRIVLIRTLSKGFELVWFYRKLTLYEKSKTFIVEIIFSESILPKVHKGSFKNHVDQSLSLFDLT